MIAHATYRTQRGERSGGPSPQATSQSLRSAAASVPTTAIDSRKSSEAVSSVIACCRSAISGRAAARLQPCREGVFAGARPRDRQQLEERAAAEQVEVVRVEMPVVGEAVAGCAAADPSVLDARQAALVEGDGARGRVARADHAVVALNQNGEPEHREEQPERATSVSSQARTATSTSTPKTASRAWLNRRSDALRAAWVAPRASSRARYSSAGGRDTP